MKHSILLLPNGMRVTELDNEYNPVNEIFLDRTDTLIDTIALSLSNEQFSKIKDNGHTFCNDNHLLDNML